MSVEVEFTSATVALRPPRVAIVVPDDSHWREWTWTALQVASEYWGGAGFILVPFNPEDGEPRQAFAEIVRAYDPDHVVSIEAPVAFWEEIHPGFFQIEGVSDEGERLRMLSHAHHTFTGPTADLARDRVAEWCAPLRRPAYGKDDNSRGHEVLMRIGTRDPRDGRHRGGLTPAVHDADIPIASASPAWRSDFGLLAAMRLGIAPDATTPRPEPDEADFDWLISNRQANVPENLVRDFQGDTGPIQRSESWFLEGQGLVQVSSAYSRDRNVVVIGDSGADFALALAYDRLLGPSVWLSEDMLRRTKIFSSIHSPLWWVITEAEQNGNFVVVTSCTASEERVRYVARKLSGLQTFGRGTDGSDHAVVQSRSPEVKAGLLHYLVNEHVGATVTLPMGADRHNSSTALHGIDTPVPSDLLYPPSSGMVPYWYVDVSISGDRSPRARDIPSSSLLIRDGVWPSVRIRSSQTTVSFDPRSMGFVPGGSFMAGRLDRPRLRRHSLRTWVDAMARTEGLGVRSSQAGRRAELLERRVGSRGALLDLITTDNLDMFRAFIPLEHKPGVGERDPETVVLGRDPYLTLAAIRRLLPGDDGESVRLVDSLTTKGLMRRGLILDCAECARASFLTIDNLGQVFPCPECAALNSLESPRWKNSGDEPVWTYDLFKIFRDLLGSNGHVPLLAAARLRGSSQTYEDASELEFYDLQTNTAVAEIDILASIDRELVLVEAKSTSRFKQRQRGPQSDKLFRIARVLRADKVILATTQDEWNTEDVDHLRSLGATRRPFPLRVGVMCGLGTAPVDRE